MSEHSVYDVFTPTTQARLNFIGRAELDAALGDALRTPGKQIIVYGESGSGKSTLLVNKLDNLNLAKITTRCSGASTYSAIILNAFDQLDEYFIESHSDATQSTTRTGIEAQFKVIKAQIGRDDVATASNQSRRLLPPQLTPQRLAEFIGSKQLCWILEDFHKVPSEEKTAIAQTLKIFSDMAADYPTLRIIALGATDTARQVVQFDPEMKNRVAEIHVPLMADTELQAVVRHGSKLLNVDMQSIARDIVLFSSGLASVTHHLCLNACVAAGVTSTRGIRLKLNANDMEVAIARYISESSDSLKALFDAALVRQRERRYHNTQLIVKALASGPIEGMSHAEIRSHIQGEHPDYPAGNVTTYLRKLQRQDRGAIVRVAADGKYRFSDPILHSYARAVFGVAVAEDAWSATFGTFLSKHISTHWIEFGGDRKDVTFFISSGTIAEGTTSIG